MAGKFVELKGSIEGKSNIKGTLSVVATITTAVSSIAINTSTSEVTVLQPIPEALASRMKENGFNEIVAVKGVAGAVECYEKYTQEGLIPGFVVAFGAHPHIKSKEGSTMSFDVDLQGQDE